MARALAANVDARCDGFDFVNAAGLESGKKLGVHAESLAEVVGLHMGLEPRLAARLRFHLAPPGGRDHCGPPVHLDHPEPRQPGVPPGPQPWQAARCEREVDLEHCQVVLAFSFKFPPARGTIARSFADRAHPRNLVRIGEFLFAGVMEDPDRSDAPAKHQIPVDPWRRGHAGGRGAPLGHDCGHETRGPLARCHAVAALILASSFKPGSSGWCGEAMYFMVMPFLKPTKLGSEL